MLAALLGWPQGTFASKVALDGDAIMVTREVDGGLQTVKLKMPAIVTTDLRLNEPRCASLPNIMKARKKPIDEKTAADYGVDTKPRLAVVKTAEPPVRKAGVQVKTVAELKRRQKNEGGAIWWFFFGSFPRKRESRRSTLLAAQSIGSPLARG